MYHGLLGRGLLGRRGAIHQFIGCLVLGGRGVGPLGLLAALHVFLAGGDQLEALGAGEFLGHFLVSLEPLLEFLLPRHGVDGRVGVEVPTQVTGVGLGLAQLPIRSDVDPGSRRRVGLGLLVVEVHLLAVQLDALDGLATQSELLPQCLIHGSLQWMTCGRLGSGHPDLPRPFLGVAAPAARKLPIPRLAALAAGTNNIIASQGPGILAQANYTNSKSGRARGARAYPKVRKE